MVDSLPPAVTIREVGPRDGFQNEPERIPTDEKVRLIEALARTGLRRLEVTSFVRAEVVPQLADAHEVLQRIDVPEEVELSVIVPNERGLEAALDHAERITGIDVFCSASDGHNRKNVNRSVEESLTVLERMVPRVREAGLRCGASLATSFGCPYDGPVDPDRVLEISRRLVDAGVDEMTYGDTTGMANPVQVADFFPRIREGLPDDVTVIAHFHNTRGQGLANALAALGAGVTTFDASFGELGGCPVPAGATGNIASEDLVSMLHEMGVATGIDLDALVACARDVQEVLGRRLTSHVIVAGPVEWNPAPTPVTT